MRAFVTQADLAKRLGVSRSTVKAALNPDPRVPLRARTRERVLAMAKEMGYRAHRQAQMLRGVRSGLMGVLHSSLYRSANAEHVHAIARAIRTAGYQVLAVDVGWHDDARDAFGRILDARVEGLILLSPNEHVSVEEILRLRKVGLPLVAWGGVELPGVCQVCPDLCGGVRLMTEHLIRIGRRRLVFAVHQPSAIRDQRHSWTMLDRLEGFHAAIRRAGGQLLSQTWDPRREPPPADGGEAVLVGEVVCATRGWGDASPYTLGRGVLQGILSRECRPDALLCYNDEWAMEALALCGELGIRVPQDLSVVGFDGTQMSGSSNPRLTTVATPVEAMAQRSVKLLLRQIQGKRPSAGDMLERLPCQLVVRASCGGRPSRPESFDAPFQQPEIIAKEA